MKIFGISEAGYFCSLFSRSIGDAERSIDDFRKNQLGSGGCMIAEGTPLFQQYRDCSLREVERSLFFAASHYRRSLDLMISSSSPWAHVTLYYGSWYASRALLGMFGCTIFSPKFVVDVNKGSLGQQELHLRRIGTRIGQEYTTYSGSHQVFWDLFYTTVQKLIPVVDPRFAAVLSPISGDRAWQIQNRNDVNYDLLISFRLAESFERLFSKEGFPGCLPGVLSTQFQILETLLELVYSYASQFGLSTDALNGLGRSEPLRGKVRHLIYDDKSPNLVQKTKKTAIT